MYFFLIHSLANLMSPIHGSSRFVVVRIRCAGNTWCGSTCTPPSGRAHRGSPLPFEGRVGCGLLNTRCGTPRRLVRRRIRPGSYEGCARTERALRCNHIARITSSTPSTCPSSIRNRTRACSSDCRVPRFRRFPRVDIGHFPTKGSLDAVV